MKKLYVLAVWAIVAANVSGCGNSEQDNVIYGQDLVKYSALYDTDSKLSYEFPIICKTQIEEFEIEGYNIIGEGDYVIDYNGLSGGEKYNDWYYYIANVSVGIDCMEAADFEVESVTMKMNGSSIVYDVANMHFANIKGKYEEKYLSNVGALLYEAGGPTHLLNKISDDLVYEVDFSVEENCVVNELGYTDFIDMSNIEVKVNGEPVEFNHKLVLNKGDYVSFQYNLKYQDGVTQRDMVKTTFFVNYSIGEEDYLFLDEQGLIVADTNNDNFIKNYIDEKIE